MPKPLEATRHHNLTNCWSFYLSEPFTFTHFNMGHPLSCGVKSYFVHIEKKVAFQKKVLHNRDKRIENRTVKIEKEQCKQNMLGMF